MESGRRVVFVNQSYLMSTTLTRCDYNTLLNDCQLRTGKRSRHDFVSSLTATILSFLPRYCNIMSRVSILIIIIVGCVGVRSFRVRYRGIRVRRNPRTSNEIYIILIYTAIQAHESDGISYMNIICMLSMYIVHV